MEWTTFFYFVAVLIALNIVIGIIGVIFILIKEFLHEFFELGRGISAQIVAVALALVSLVLIFFILLGIFGLLIIGWERILAFF